MPFRRHVSGISGSDSRGRGEVRATPHPTCVHQEYPEQDRARARVRRRRPTASRLCTPRSTAATTGTPPFTAIGCSRDSRSDFRRRRSRRKRVPPSPAVSTPKTSQPRPPIYRRADRALVRAPLWPRLAASRSAPNSAPGTTRRRATGRSALAATRNRGRRESRTLAARPDIRDPRRRARPDGVRVRTDLGLDTRRGRRAPAHAARERGAALLSTRLGLPVALRALGPRLPVTLHRRSRFHAARSRRESVSLMARPDSCREFRAARTRRGSRRRS